MEKLGQKFQEFLDDGARENLLSEEFGKDVEFHMSDTSDLGGPSPGKLYRTIHPSDNFYSPDHDLEDPDEGDDKSSGGSYIDPLNDDTTSLLGDLERIACLGEQSPEWDGSSKVVWTSPGIYRDPEEFNRHKNLLKSVIRSINRDSGSSYTLNVGQPTTLFITRADSLTISKATRRPALHSELLNDTSFGSVLTQFKTGIKLADKDEPGKYLTVSINTQGFGESEIKKAFQLGNTKVKDILEYIWKQKGRWNYIMSSYDVTNIVEI